MAYTPYTPTWNNPYLPQGAVNLPYQTPQPYQQPTTYQQPFNGIVKVNGRESAMQYQLPPNSTSIPLIDSSFDGKKGIFYVVSTDGAGAKTIEPFDFCPHVEQQPVQIDGAQFVSRQEFDEFTAKVNAAIGAINGSHAAVPTTVPAAGTADGAEGKNVAAKVNDARGPVASAL